MTSALGGVAPFVNHLPVRIRFGAGEAEHLAALLAGEHIARLFVVIDAGLEQENPRIAAAMYGIEQGCSALARFEKPPGEPTSTVVDAAAGALSAVEADAIVAIGGGSALDTAKAARLCTQLGCSFASFLSAPTAIPEAVIPLIAVPTTAGTGSEVSGGAVVTDASAARKVGIADANLRPTYAIVDPLLTHSVPPTITAYTGVDALAQAIAAMVARTRTPIGDAVALDAVRLVGRSLVRAYEDPDNAHAREEMACGSLMAGIAMNISDCAAEHSLAQAIGGLVAAPHGLTVGLVLAETLERERQYVGGQLERVADALGVPDHGAHDGSRAVGEVRRLLADLDFPVLRSIGVDESHLDELTDRALGDAFIERAPWPWTAEEVRLAFESALSCRQSRKL
jgi:choline dehydrogenase